MACGGDDETPAGTPVTTPDTTVSETSTPTDTGADTAAEQAPCDKGKACYGGQCCTCSPGKQCDAGIDNTLSGLSGLANGPLQKAVDEGSVNLVAEFVGNTGDGKEFTMNMYNAEVDPATECAADGDAKDCDYKAGNLKWLLSESAFDATCAPLIAFKNAKITGTKLTAGGPDGVFKLTIPIAGIDLVLTVTHATIEGEVTMTGSNITKIAGLLAGAVPKAALEAAVDNIPPDKLPISKDAIKGILNNVVKEDIDALDASGNPGTDGVLESSSIAIKFVGVPGTITGVLIKEPAVPAPPPPDADAGGAPAEDISEDVAANSDLIEPPPDDNGMAPPPEDTGTIPPPPDKCMAYPTTFSAVAFRIATLGLGEDAKPGNGLDVDHICVEPTAPLTCPAAGG